MSRIRDSEVSREMAAKVMRRRGSCKSRQSRQSKLLEEFGMKEELKKMKCRQGSWSRDVIDVLEQ